MSFILHVIKQHVKSLLDSAALILGIVNALFLLKFYLRDRPQVEVRPVHPDSYQWWFQLPDADYQGRQTRRWGFLAYIDVLNRGLRETELDTWSLRIPTAKRGPHTMSAMNMPEPKITIGELSKSFRVLGQEGIVGDGSTLTKPGCSIAGMAFFEYECYGDASRDPAIKDGKIQGTFIVRTVFGRQSSCRVDFSEKSLQEIIAMAPGIDKTSGRPKR